MSIVYTFKYKSDIMYNLVLCELLSSIFVCHCGNFMKCHCIGIRGFVIKESSLPRGDDLCTYILLHYTEFVVKVFIKYRVY